MGMQLKLTCWGQNLTGEENFSQYWRRKGKIRNGVGEIA